MKNTSNNSNENVITFDDIMQTLHNAQDCNKLIDAIKEHKKQFNNRASSLCDNPVKTVFTIANTMTNARRCDVIRACVEAGVNKHTAQTQYQIWYGIKKHQHEA